ncbi:hypothetical protein [Amycolatopsis sp. lyj-112]|uniref:hypothetical protein n=1 Tax=Amycolatopsis sp. lyj-112 TaxID=2789288 RepID=UPI00397C7033
MSTTTDDFGELGAEFNTYVGAINYATMVTIDAENRPRTRVLIPVWEKVDDRPVGWLATYRTRSRRHTSKAIRTPTSLTGHRATTQWPSTRSPSGTTNPRSSNTWRIQVIRGGDLRSRIWRADRS